MAATNAARAIVGITAVGKARRQDLQSDLSDTTADNHRQIFLNILSNKGYKSPGDLSKVRPSPKIQRLCSKYFFVKVSSSEIAKMGGASVLTYYNNSPITALRNLFPEVHWDPLSFTKVPRNYWDSSSNVKVFVSSLVVVHITYLMIF
jgi:hypothetical protein